MDFLKARRRTRFDRLDALVLAVYAAVLAWAIAHHFAGDDEAQAWLLARDSSLHELLFRRLHYEGAPALWPMILWIAARMHMPYAGMNWLGGAFALSGVFLLLRYSPFPRIVRWLLPFTFFLQYQYAVIARPYVLFPALLFTLCILFPLAKPRPVLFALVAGALVNVSLHAAILAGIFALLYLYDLYRLNRRSPGLAAPRGIAAATGLFVLLCIAAFAAAFPAPDVGLASSPDKYVVKPHAFLQRLIPAEHLPSGAPALDDPIDSTGTNDKPGQPARKPVLYPAIVRIPIVTAILGASVACFPIARSNLIAIAFLVCFALWLRSRGSLRLLLPFAIACLLSVHVLVYDHHTGQFALALAAAAWIALNSPLAVAPPGPPAARWIQPAFAALALLVIVLQIGWSYHCIHSETFHPYDPGHETEAFLVHNYSGKRIAGFSYESVSTQAYAPHSLFFNQPHAYWVWSVPVSIDRRRTEALQQHPDVVVAGDLINREDVVSNQWLTLVPPGRHGYAQMLDFWERNGYRATHRFCGDRFMRMGVTDTFCEVIFEPAAGSAALHTAAGSNAAK